MAVWYTAYDVVGFTSGHRISVYNQIRPITVKRNLPIITRHIDRAKAHDLKTRDLENQWEAQTGRTLYPGELPGLDGTADRTLTSVRDIAVAQLEGLPPGDPLHDKVDHFLTDVFPAGVFAITSLPYVEQVVAMEVIVDKMQRIHAPLMRELGLERKVAQLAGLTVAYRACVDKARPLDFATVRDARQRGQEYLLEIIGLIIGTYHDGDNPEHEAARNELLAPIQAHDEMIRAGLRARRARGEAPAGDVPVDEAPVDDVPADEAPADEAPADPAPFRASRHDDTLDMPIDALVTASAAQLVMEDRAPAGSNAAPASTT